MLLIIISLLVLIIFSINFIRFLLMNVVAEKHVIPEPKGLLH